MEMGVAGAASRGSDGSGAELNRSVVERDLEKSQAALQEFIRRQQAGQAAGDDALRVGGLTRLSGGASCEVYGFDLHAGDEPTRAMVLRADRPGKDFSASRADEYAVLREAEQAGVTVPHAHWLGSADDGLGVPFMVMDFVPGLALGQRLLRDDAYASTREALPAQLAGELARLHAAAPGHRLPGATPAGDDPRRFALAAVKQWTAAAATLHTDYPRPALDLAARWLKLNAPSVQEPVLVHGDFRIGNIMFDERGLTAVLDWELAHLGDPAEDLGWLCVRSWRFGRDHPAVGGLCTRDRLLELYREAGGRAVSADQLRYWEIFGNWKWAVICLLQAASARAGSRPDVELAAIGRRVPAVEWELVDLLDREQSQ